MPENFSPEEKKILEPFFSNMDKDIFVLTNLPEVVKGALFSRYSRSAKSLRRLLLEEFINDNQTGFKEIVNYQVKNGSEQIVAIQKAEEFYDRVLVGYGDDSVAELGGAHIAVENVSNICAKVLEDSRLGISPLEKSTRYVFFDKKFDDKYLYHREQDIQNSSHAQEFTQLCDELFDAYSDALEPTKEFLIEKFPKTNDASDRAYNSTIKAKACDILRVFLPAATLTNVGLYGNGRSLEYLLTKMYSFDLKEIQNTAATMHEELKKVIPSFVRRARGQFGEPTIEFFKSTREGMQKIADKNFSKEQAKKSPEVVLSNYDKDGFDKAITATLYPFTNLPLTQLHELVKKMTKEQKMKVINEYESKRQNRRHKPGRGFEHAFFEFDLLGNYGIYRDLHRHRVMTQQKQLLSTFNGYDSPSELKELGLEEKYDSLMKKSDKLFRQIHQKMPQAAQYIVPFGYRIRWAVNINARELYHLIELRSTPQGHPDYRRMVIKMFEEAKAVQPELMSAMKFVQTQDVELERLEAEKMTDKKIDEVNKKYSKQ